MIPEENGNDEEVNIDLTVSEHYRFYSFILLCGRGRERSAWDRYGGTNVIF